MPVRTTSFAAIASLAALFAAGADAASAKTAAPKLIELRCVPKTKPACKTKPKVVVGAQVQFRGQRLKRNMRVSFRWPKGALATKLSLTNVGWVARVPAGT